MIVRAAAILVLCLGCMKTSGLKQPIGVRIAAPDEAFTGPTIVVSSNSYYCGLDGDPANDLFGPLVQFAREHLIQLVDRGARANQARAYLVRSGRSRTPRQRAGVEILVAPRTRVGVVVIQSKRGDAYDALAFCVDVRRESAGTSLVLFDRRTAYQRTR